jgi:hypothetical protein
MVKKKKAKRGARKKSNIEKNIEASSISVQKMAVLATIISVVVGGLSGYLGSRFKTNALKSMKKDEIAHSLVKAYFEEMDRSGIISKYTPIEHWAVQRFILEGFDPSKPATPEDIRDRIGRSMQACQSHRMAITELFYDQAGSPLEKKKQSVYEIESDNVFIDTIPNTPEGKKYKEIFRKLVESEIRRLGILEAMTDKERMNRTYELMWKEIKKMNEERGPLLELSKELSEKNEELQQDK